MAQPVLVAGARTPIGKMLGSLSGLTAPALGGTAIRAALERAGITGDQVDAVILGNVVQAGVGPNPARLAAVAGGIPFGAPATTVNKLCLSGLAAIAQAAQQITAGHCEVVVAGGIESMSNAPYLLPRAGYGFRYGDTPLVDALDQDALVCGFDGIPMGVATERYQADLGISREDQDFFAAESHARAVAAIKDGRLAEEIIPVTVLGREGDVTVEQDEGVRPGTTAERLARMRPAFSAGGTITAGSASQLSDGACAVIVMSKERAEREGLPWLAEIGSYGTVAGPDPSLLYQPANAIRDALRRDGALGLGDLDLLEITEAFAVVTLASARDLGLSLDRVNVNGGAIALGHPVGATGARLFATLLAEMERRDAETGLVTMCCGGGLGTATLVQRLG